MTYGASENLHFTQCEDIFSVRSLAAGTEENITVAGGAQTHMLTDLEVENTYSVRMDSVTAAGYSHTSSKPIYQLTTSAGSGKSCYSRG